MAQQDTPATPQAHAPIVVDLGKKTKKSIRRMKEGSGKMLAEVELVLEEVRAQLPPADRQKALVPVVMFVERKHKKTKFPFSPLSMLR